MTGPFSSAAAGADKAQKRCGVVSLSLAISCVIFLRLVIDLVIFSEPSLLARRTKSVPTKHKKWRKSGDLAWESLDFAQMRRIVQ
jgi:hypothetical protein